MDSYSYIVELVDQVSGPAKIAGAEVLNFGQRMAALRAAKAPIKAIEDAFAALPAATAKSSAGMENLTDRMLKSQAAAGNLTEQMLKSQAGMKPIAMPPPNVKPITDAGKATFNAAQAVAVGKATITAAIAGIGAAFSSLEKGDAKGVVEGVTSAVAGMAKALDLVVPGLGEAVSAVVSIAGGLAGVTVGLIQSGAAFAIQSTQAKTQMLAMFDALGAGVITGAQVDDMLDGLSAKLGQTKDTMTPIVQAFAAMGITSQDALEKMTTAALSAKALAGGAESGVQAFEKLSKKIQLASETGQGLKIPIKGLGSLAEMGLTVDDVAKKMGISAAKLAAELKAGTTDAAKFGDAMQDALIEKGAGPLAKMGLAGANLKALLQQYIGDMFEDMSADVEPFMAAIKDLFSIFDSKSKPSGAALKAGIGGFFHEVFSIATKVVPVVKNFLLDMIIYGLKAYIALKPIVKTIKDFANSAEGAAMIATVLSSLWEVLKAVGVTVAVVVALSLALWAAMIAVSIAVWTVVGAILSFVADAGAALTSWIGGAASAAYDFVAGLVQGIAGGGGQVVDAVKGLASSATGAFKNALGIASPSKVMAELGGYTTDGFAMGVEDGTKDTQGALEGAVAIPSPQGGGGGAGAGGGPTVVIESIVIQAGGANAGELLELLTSQLADKLEELLMQRGGAPAT